MKYTSVLLLVVIMLALPSCKKKYCWKCKTTTYISPSGGAQPSVTDNVVCDKTESEINDYKKGMTTTSRSGNVTVSLVTACSKE